MQKMKSHSETYKTNMQNSLRLNNRLHKSRGEFKEITCLPARKNDEQSINSSPDKVFVTIRAGHIRKFNIWIT